MTRRSLAPFVAAAFVALVGVGACVRWVAAPLAVAGPSMEPTLLEGDRVLVDLWSFRMRAPRRGEIVVVELEDGIARVKRIASDPLPSETFGEEAFVVLGDSASRSDDSRRFGPVPRDLIRGRVAFRYWPPSRAGPIR